MEKCQLAMQEHAASLGKALLEQSRQIEEQLNAGFFEMKVKRWGTPEDQIKSVEDELERFSSAIQAMIQTNRASTDHLTRSLLLLRSTVCDFHRQEAERSQKLVRQVQSNISALGRRFQAEKAQLQASLHEKTEECSMLEAEKAVQEVSLREELQACQICMTKPRNVVLVPCLHAHFCVECLDEYRKQDANNNNGCPTCRSPIRGTFPYIA